ncbi:MAG: hypothetical protein JHC85_08985 [Chthoniobacterales bacterium]|nr:hypothetical protein [Chthoniobacterales bacterium]
MSSGDSMNRMCLITFYAGDLPPYFRFFVESCKRNPDVQFIVFNDRIGSDRHEENVLLKKLSLGEFERLVEDKTGLRVKVPRGYKLNDFKPLYRLLFEDHLRDHGFWGHCDVDLIFGKIGDFITEDLLEKYDVITSKPKWISGHFSVFRNNAFCRRLFEQNPSHRWILEDSEHNWFMDESCRRWKGEFYTIEQLLAANMPVSMYDVVRNLQQAGKLRAAFTDFIREHTLCDRVDYLYKDGRLTDLTKGEDFFYHHLITIKTFWHFYVPGGERVPDAYRITDGGIRSLTDQAGWRYGVWQAKRAAYYARGVVRSVLRHARLG